MGEDGGRWPCPSLCRLCLSLSVTGCATNGLLFQGFLANVFFFVLCALEYSFIHVVLFFFFYFTPPDSPFSFAPPTHHYPPSLRLPACLPVCPPLTAVVCSSARRHAGVTGKQAAWRKPAPAGQPGNTLPTDQHTPTERQRPQLPSVEQDQGKNQPGLRCCVCIPV